MLRMIRFATTAIPKPTEKATKAYKYYLQGIESWDRQDSHTAQLLFEAAIDLHPTSDSLFNLANCHYTLGNHSEAISHWRKSLHLEERADTHVNIANALATLKKSNPTGVLNSLAEDPMHHYRRALALSPSDGEIRYNYAVVLEFAGLIDEAIVQYTAAKDLGIEHAEKNLRNVMAKKAGIVADQVKEKEVKEVEA